MTTQPNAQPTPATDQLNAQVLQLQSALDEARDAVQQLERRQRINELLAEADARDLSAARLLTEAAIEQMDDPDLELAVRDLKQHKPWLFRRHASPPPTATAMPARFTDADDALADAAAQVQTSGDRRSLLNYLRLRRRAKAGA